MGRGDAAATMATVAELRALAEQVAPTTLSIEHRLPVLDALAPLFPGGGLRRGATVGVSGPAAMSLALAVAAGASLDGAWVAAIGFPSLGLLAAADVGVAIERFVLVAAPDTTPGPDNESVAWASAVAALVDAFDVVLVASDDTVRPRDARRLVSRVRERESVLVPVGSSWPEGPDVSLTVTAAEWEGLGGGHGHLRARRVTVAGGGRRDAARPRRAQLWLPAADGAIATAGPSAEGGGRDHGRPASPMRGDASSERMARWSRGA